MIPNCTIWITKIQKSQLDNLKSNIDEPYYVVLDRLLGMVADNGIIIKSQNKNSPGKK